MSLQMGFEGACSLLERVLSGATRAEIATEVSTSSGVGRALRRLRDSMRSHVWRAGAGEIGLGRLVKAYDARTREEGFHVLHDWDGKADAVNPDIIPIDVLDYVLEKRGQDAIDRNLIAILLDYYFLHILALLSLRIWDEGDADVNLDRLNQLLRDLQGANGSGQQFADNAETLILIASSHYELHERGYGGLLEKARRLNSEHRVNVALGHAASMGSHLRFGFEVTYARDTHVMRNDNVADYPWLCFALLTLMREYSRLHDASIHGLEREIVVGALLNGLSPDARAFVGEPPASLSAAACVAERCEFAERFRAYRRDLVAEFERHRPSAGTYSPLSFFFNFSHNVVKGTVVDALLRGEAWHLTLNDLLTGVPREGGGHGGAETDRGLEGRATSGSKLALAETLMGYARANPDRINGRLRPVIVYDSQSGQQVFTITMRKINEPPFEGSASCR